MTFIEGLISLLFCIFYYFLYVVFFFFFFQLCPVRTLGTICALLELTLGTICAL